MGHDELSGKCKRIVTTVGIVLVLIAVTTGSIDAQEKTNGLQAFLVENVGMSEDECGAIDKTVIVKQIEAAEKKREMVVFGIFMVAFQFIPPITIVILPLILLLEFIVILGLALPLSVLTVKIKDIQFIWNVVVYAGFFLLPIFYKTEILPPVAQDLLRFDPMIQFLNFTRDSALYNNFPSGENLFIALGMTGLIFLVGYIIFRKSSSKIIEEL